MSLNRKRRREREVQERRVVRAALKEDTVKAFYLSTQREYYDMGFIAGVKVGVEKHKRHLRECVEGLTYDT